MKATYIDHGGSDLTIVNAARVSFSNTSEWEEYDIPDPLAKDGTGTPFITKGKRLKQKDVNLIEYLARGMPRSEWEALMNQIALGEGRPQDEIITELMRMAQHWVPFTHNWIHLHMVAPVPIARQMFKAKIGFTESEESRRYVSDTPTLYIPDEFRAKADNIKQGSGGKHPQSDDYVRWYTEMCKSSIELYENMVEKGVAPEQARFVLPQGVEVQWKWSGNVASFARMYNQRVDSHAQLESQILAKEIGKIIEPLFPVSWKALTGSKRTDVDV